MAELEEGDALASNHLNDDDGTTRFCGQTAVVNGNNSWKQRDGETGPLRLGRYLRETQRQVAGRGPARARGPEKK